MATALTKVKKSGVKSNRRRGNFPVGVSMLTLSGFRICQMQTRQLNSVSLQRSKAVR